jgi:hypothetical protein
LLLALALLTGGALATPSSAAAWTLDDVRGARYGGVEGIPGEFHLVQGKWTGQPLDPGAASKPTVMVLDDTLVTGEATGAAHPEAAVVLAASFGGSGVFHYLAVVERRDGRPVSRQTWALGDRVQIKQVQIHGRRILVDMVRSGPGDPGDACLRCGARPVDDCRTATPRSTCGYRRPELGPAHLGRWRTGTIEPVDIPDLQGRRFARACWV